MLDCQTPDPSFTPVDSSSGNATNCFTDVAVVAYGWAHNPTLSTYGLNASNSYSNNSQLITANRSAEGVYNMVFSGYSFRGLGNTGNGDIQVTASNDTVSPQTTYCTVLSVFNNTVEIRCYDAFTNALKDSQYHVSITDKTTSGSDAKITAYAIANDKDSLSYTPNLETSYNGFSGSITAKRITDPFFIVTGKYSMTFPNANFTDDLSFQVTPIQSSASSPKAHCRVDTWTTTTVNIFCFDESGAPLRTEYSLTVIEQAVQAVTTKIVGYAHLNINGLTPAYNQNGPVTFNYSGGGTYKVDFVGLDLTNNYNVQVVTHDGTDTFLNCVLGPVGPVTNQSEVEVSCYNQAGVASPGSFSIWVVQK